jgi:hypothetical protein
VAVRSSFIRYLHGHILTELQEVIERPEETDDVLRLGLHRLPVTDFPNVRALASALANYDGAAELDRGLDLLLVGLTATVASPARSPRGRGDADAVSRPGRRSRRGNPAVNRASEELQGGI